MMMPLHQLKLGPRTDYVYSTEQTMNNMSFAIWFTTFNKDGSVRNNNVPMRLNMMIVSQV
jgi:hypothetical protein